MSLLNTIQLIQLCISIMLTVLVLVQGKGTGLSSAVGNTFSLYRSKRGVERVVFILTILMGVTLVINSFALVFVN